MKEECKVEIQLTDKVVSNNIKKRRMELGLTQHDLAEVIGVSTQQVQKYEKGINRISSGKLNNLAAFLKVPVNYFFQQDNEIISMPIDDVKEKKVISFIKAFKNIKEPKLKNSIIEFIELIANN